MEVFRYSIFSLIVFLYSFPCGAQIYQWVDEQGVTHFSESPKGTPEEAYPVNPVKNSPPEDAGGISENKSEKQQVTEPGKAMDVPKREWPACSSELCEKVKKTDPDCKTQDCIDAARFTNDCHTILCLSDRIDFENKINAILKNSEQSTKPEKVVKEPAKEEKEKLTDEEVLEKCKKERRARCKKYLEYYRDIYNGTSEERKKAWNDMKNARNLRFKKEK